MIALSPLEWEILSHRLDLDSALAECLESDPDETYDLCRALFSSYSDGKLETSRAAAFNAELTRDILIDCVEGGTYYAASADDVANLSPQKIAAIGRACESLADKIGEYVGRTLCYPM